MFKHIAELFLAHNIKFYSIGQHVGLCDSPFVVIKENTDNATINKNIHSKIIDIHLYYPVGSYSKVEAYIESVINALSQSNKIKPVYDGAPIIIEDQKKAYTTRLSYQVLKSRRF